MACRAVRARRGRRRRARAPGSAACSRRRGGPRATAPTAPRRRAAPAGADAAAAPGVTCIVVPRYSNGSPVSACVKTRDLLLVDAPAAVERDAEHRELRRDVAGDADDLDPAPAEVVDDDDVLGGLHRVAQREDDRGDPDADALGAGRDRPPRTPSATAGSRRRSRGAPRGSPAARRAGRPTRTARAPRRTGR